MKHKAFGSVPRFIYEMESIGKQVDIMVPRDLPGDDLSREQVDDDTQIKPLTSYMNKCCIAGSYLIGFFGIKLLPKII